MKIIYILSLTILLQSCISSSIMQTAKPLEKGEFEGSLGLNGFYGETGLHWGWTGNGPDIMVAPEIMARYGINGKSDIGVANYMGKSNLRFDYKHVILKSLNDKSYLSSGFMVELYFGPNWQLNELRGTLPLYASFNHGNAVVPYFVQRFSYNFDVPLYSGGGGLRFGKNEFKWFVEFSTFQYYSSDQYVNHVRGTFGVTQTF